MSKERSWNARQFYIAFSILFFVGFMGYLGIRDANKRRNEVKFVMDNLPNDSLRREYSNTYMSKAEKKHQQSNE